MGCNLHLDLFVVVWLSMLQGGDAGKKPRPVLSKGTRVKFFSTEPEKASVVGLSVSYRCVYVCLYVCNVCVFVCMFACAYPSVIVVCMCAFFRSWALLAHILEASGVCLEDLAVSCTPFLVLWHHFGGSGPLLGSILEALRYLWLHLGSFGGA